MNFAGFLIGAIFYGIVIVLFFQCMYALLRPANRKGGGIRWWLVAHTVAMFSFATIYTALNLDIQSNSYIDNREFPGSPDGSSPPGPFGYQYYIYSRAIDVVPSVVFALNNWLADGLLLYRCFITYSNNYWIIAFPFLIYLATYAMGIAFIFQIARPLSFELADGGIMDFGTPYYAISLSLNIILTLMIVVRLMLHSKNVRSAMGTQTRTGGIYKAVVSMLVESCALYAVSYLLFMAPWAAGSPVSNAFFPILAETQVIAPFLIVLRVANRKALTSDSVAKPGSTVTSLRFLSRGKSTGVHPDEYSMDSTVAYGKTPNELCAEATSMDLPHDKV